MDNMTFAIRTEFIELIKLLKVIGIASTGGMAKMLVDDGLVSVNGETEYRKRRKIRNGDIVKYDAHKITIK